MTLRNSWPGPSGVTTTTDARIVLGGLIENYASGAPRTGLFPTNLNPIVNARSDMNVDILAFQGVANQFGGTVLIANDGTIQLPAVLVSPASGTNYYVVYAKQDEATSPGTDADNLPKVGSVLSTTSVAAARALLPTGALELATVQVPSGVAATNAAGVTITQTFTYTVAEGGVVPVRNSTELAAWTPADASLAWQIDTAQMWTRQGGVWTLAGGALPHFGYLKTGAYSFTSTNTIFQWDASATEGALAGFTTTDQKTFTCSIAGVYDITAQATSQGLSPTAIYVFLYKNGTNIRTAADVTSTSGYVSVQLQSGMRFAVGDTFAIYLGGGGTVPGQPGTNLTYLDVDFRHA